MWTCQTVFQVMILGIRPTKVHHRCHIYSSGKLWTCSLNSDVHRSFARVCWRHHNATLSHSKCFWIGICSLSRKMESRGGPGFWKGHIWGPPLWVFTFKDKWSHWVPATCEWAPSAHTGFLNAHQNNLSKPRDAFLRCLMWGQIGNHFNKIPVRLNCICQKTRPEWGETQGTAMAEPLPALFKKRVFIVLTGLQWMYVQMECVGTKMWLRDCWGWRFPSY